MNSPDTTSAGAALVGWILATGIAWCWGSLLPKHLRAQHIGLRLLYGQACWYLALFMGHFWGGLNAPVWLLVGGLSALFGWYQLFERLRRGNWRIQSTDSWVFAGSISILFLYSIKSCPYEYCAYDAHLYWDATVDLNQRSGVTRGIGLVHDRLGFGSLWHVGAAFYESAVEWHTCWKGLNAWWLWAFGLWAWQVATRRQQLAPLVAWGGLCFFFYPYLSEHQPDLGIAIWSVVFLDCSWLYFSGNRFGESIPVAFLALLILPLVKLSALTVVVPAGLAWCWQLYKENTNLSGWKQASPWVFVLILFWGLQGVKNTLQTGYPLYPVSSFSIPPEFGASRRIDWDTLEHQQQQIRMLAFDPGGKFDPEFLKRPLSEQYHRAWTVAWFSQKIEMVIMLVGFCVWIVGLCRYPLLHWPAITGWLSIGIWAASAPDPRFIHGTVLVTIAYVFEQSLALHQKPFMTRPGALFIMMVVVLGLILALPALKP